MVRVSALGGGAGSDVTAIHTRTFYISQSTGSDSNTGLTTADPWQTIGKVNGLTHVAGDSYLFLRGDTWTDAALTITGSGTEYAPITFGAYGSGSSAKPAFTNAAATGINASARSWIVIEGLAVTGWLTRGIRNLNGDHWVVRDCDVSGGDAPGGSGSNVDRGIECSGVLGDYIDGVLIERCRIGAIGAGNGSVNRAGIIVGYARNAAIRDNEAATGTCIAILANFCDDALVKDNHIHGSGPGIVVWDCLRAVVRENDIYNCTGAGIAVSFDCADTVLVGNTIHDLGRDAVFWNGIDVNNGCAGGLVEGNHVWKVERHCFVIDDATGVGTQRDGVSAITAACTGWVIKNNVFDARANTDTGGNPVQRVSIGNRGETANTGFVEDYNVLLPDPTFGAGDVVVCAGNVTTEAATDYTLATWRTHGTDGDHSTDSIIGTTDLAANAVTLAKMATQADQTILGNVAGSTAVPVALTKAQVVTALQAAVGGVTKLVRCSADTTVNDSSALVDITGLAFAIAANEIWFAQVWLMAKSASTQTPDWKFGWTYPSGCTADWGGVNGVSPGTQQGWTTAAVATIPSAILAITGVMALGGSNNRQGLGPFGAIFTASSTPGTIQFQFAQNTATAENTTIYQLNSFMLLTRLA